MRPTNKILLTIAISLFFTYIAQGQTITPNEIRQINNLKNQTEISNLLKEKGFEFSQSRGIKEIGDINSIEDSWIFRPLINRKEIITSILSKTTDYTHNSKITLTLYNFYHYRDFINNLLSSNFEFKGLKTIPWINYSKNGKTEYTNYSYFIRSNLLFLTRENIGYDGTTFYEIIFEPTNNGR